MSGNIQQNGFGNSAWTWSTVSSSKISVNKSGLSEVKKTNLRPVEKMYVGTKKYLV